ncbi:MAG: response regulator [Vulcanimicrobiaceae bacterium]|jgi:FixJ family two-component response regulator
MTTDDQPVVYVVDDDVSVRDAVSGVAKSVGLRALTFASTAEFLQCAPSDGPSCLVLDVRLPGVSGLDFQTELLRGGVHMPIIFITGYGDVAMTVRAMKAGAVEFLTKPFRDQELLDAIHQALERDRARRRRDTDGAAVRRRFDSLTPRERQVMNFVVAGRLNKEIAAELGTSEITVKVQRGQVMRKMEADSLIDLVRMAWQLEGREGSF